MIMRLLGHYQKDDKKLILSRTCLKCIWWNKHTDVKLNVYIQLTHEIVETLNGISNKSWWSATYNLHSFDYTCKHTCFDYIYNLHCCWKRRHVYRLTGKKDTHEKRYTCREVNASLTTVDSLIIAHACIRFVHSFPSFHYYLSYTCNLCLCASYLSIVPNQIKHGGRIRINSVRKNINDGSNWDENMMHWYWLMRWSKMSSRAFGVIWVWWEDNYKMIKTKRKFNWVVVYTKMSDIVINKYAFLYYLFDGQGVWTFHSQW